MSEQATKQVTEAPQRAAAIWQGLAKNWKEEMHIHAHVFVFVFIPLWQLACVDVHVNALPVFVQLACV